MTEVRSAFQIGRSREEYFETINGKTAALFAASCRIGALTGGLASAEVEACTEYGRCFGMVFQIRDDVLDFTATDGQLLKPVGQDLAEGVYTLPALVALADPDAGPDLQRPARPAAGPTRAGQGTRPSSWAPAPSRRRSRRRGAGSTNAQTATDGISRPELRAGLSRLVAELLSDVP